MEVPFEIRRGYDLLEQGVVGDAQAHFEKFLQSREAEDELRSRALTGLAMISRRSGDWRTVLDRAILSVRASGPRRNMSWQYIQEAAEKLYTDELIRGTCAICQSALVCPPELEPADICCPYHEGGTIDWN